MVVGLDEPLATGDRQTERLLLTFLPREPSLTLLKYGGADAEVSPFWVGEESQQETSKEDLPVSAFVWSREPRDWRTTWVRLALEIAPTLLMIAGYTVIGAFLVAWWVRRSLP